MSGRKQHYIPKCLLDGFESPGRGKTIKVFVFKKGQPPYCSSTLDVAASRYFYSELSESDVLSLDDQITLYEGDLGRLLIQLRSAPLNSDIDATIAAEVITHLTLRVAHVRDMCSLVMNQMLTGSADLFSQKKHMRKFLGVDADVLPAHLEEALEKQFCEQEVMLTKLNLPKPVLKQMAFMFLKENFDSFFVEHSPKLKTMINDLSCHSDMFARNGHNKALASNLMPEARVAHLSQLRWTIIAAPENGLILPDCVALATRCDGNITEPYFMVGSDNIDTVLLPICSSKLLVGYGKPERLPNIQSFNKTAAICSHTFFVGPGQTEECLVLAERIGESSKSRALLAVAGALKKGLNSP